MKLLNKWLILLLCLIAAIACYITGSVRGFGFFIFIGMLFELGFWIGVFKIKTTKSNKEEN